MRARSQHIYTSIFELKENLWCFQSCYQGFYDCLKIHCSCNTVYGSNLSQTHFKAIACTLIMSNFHGLGEIFCYLFLILLTIQWNFHKFMSTATKSSLQSLNVKSEFILFLLNNFCFVFISLIWMANSKVFPFYLGGLLF